MPALPYKLACLCDLRDERGRVLLLRRKKSPNLGLCSPVGGKLDMEQGESPAECARREIHEEVGLDLPADRVQLAGLITERAFEGKGHWLMFYYRVRGAVSVEPHEMDEGLLEWHEPETIAHLPLPETDRKIIWPLIWAQEGRRDLIAGFGNPGPGGPEGTSGAPDAAGPHETRNPGAQAPNSSRAVFVVHIDCSGPEMRWTVDQTSV